MKRGWSSAFSLSRKSIVIATEGSKSIHWAGLNCRHFGGDFIPILPPLSTNSHPVGTYWNYLEAFKKSLEISLTRPQHF